MNDEITIETLPWPLAGGSFEYVLPNDMAIYDMDRPNDIVIADKGETVILRTLPNYGVVTFRGRMYRY